MTRLLGFFRQISFVQGIVLAVASLSACASAPEEVAVEAVHAMCEKDTVRLKDLLTEDSFRLYQGILVTAPSVLACSAGSLEVASVRPMDEEGGMVRVGLSGGGRNVQNMLLHRRDGTWRVDLFMIGWDDSMSGEGWTGKPGGAR